MTTKPNTTTTPAPTQNQTLPKTGVDGSATVKGMQTTLEKLMQGQRWRVPYLNQGSKRKETHSKFEGKGNDHYQKEM